MRQVVLDVISSKRGILKTLLHSHSTGALIGIRSKLLGRGTYFTVVKDISLGEEEVVVRVQGSDVTGYNLERNTLTIADIDDVIPLTAFLDDPYVRSEAREAAGDF